MDVKIEQQWKEKLSSEFDKDYFVNLVKFLHSEKAAGKTIYPINTINAINVVRRNSSSQVANSVTYIQNMEKRASIQVTTILGTPSHILVLDSRSYFFITESRSMASSGIESIFLKNAIVFSFHKNNIKMAAMFNAAATS